MRFTSRLYVSLAAVFCLQASVQANPIAEHYRDFQLTRETGDVSYVIDIDNDSLLLTDRDGLYTNGMKFSAQSVRRQASGVHVAGWHIGHDTYTPTDIKILPDQIAPNERPYAAWLYGGVYSQHHRADGTYSKLGVDVGCLGPCAGGRSIQTAMHRLLGDPVPEGWARQIRNEVGVVLSAEMAPWQGRLGHYFDVTPHVNGRLGNIFSDVGGGVTARLGRVNLFPQDDALFAYLRVQMKHVFHDATLEGGYFGSKSRHPHTVAPKRNVGEIELGANWKQGDYGVRMSIVRRTNTVREMANSVGAQSFLRLQFIYAPSRSAR